MHQNLEQIKILHGLCNKICDEPKIRFCGVISSMGKLVAGSFKDGIEPLDNEQQRLMLYIQSKLELSMKSEFNDNLGIVNFILTYRDNVVVINIPIKNQQYHILISAERIANVKKIAEEAVGLFDENGIILTENRHEMDPTQKIIP